MNFYVSSLIPLILFTILFYINWSRLDKKVDEGKFARFLFYGILMGVLYSVLFVYAYLSLSKYIDLMIFAVLLLLPVIASGSQLSVLSGKYKTREDLIPLSSSLGSSYSLPISFIIAMLTSPSIPNYIYIAFITIFSFVTFLMSSVTIAIGIKKGRVMLYYSAAFLIQMLFSSSIFFEYLYGSYSLMIIIPEILFAVLLYIFIFHKKIVSE